MSPDSAVGIDAKSEEQTLRSEANGSLPLSRQRSSAFDYVVKATIIDCEVGENDFKTHDGVLSLRKISPSLSRCEGLVAESGMGAATYPTVMQGSYFQ
jgi:hypothetical protein